MKVSNKKKQPSAMELRRGAYTADEAAQLIGVNRRTLYMLNLRKTGPGYIRLPHKKILYPRIWMEAYLERTVQLIRRDADGAA